MRRATLGVLLVAVIGAGIWCWLARNSADAEMEIRANSREPAKDSPFSVNPTPSQAARGLPELAATSPKESTPRLISSDTKPANANEQSRTTSPAIEAGIAPVTVMENVRSVFQQYRAQFGGNPVGDNHEITACLNGANSRRARFIKPDDGLRVNESGELIDNWGTPFFFHQVSRNEMEIRSAGPDRKMWSKDDLILK